MIKNQIDREGEKNFASDGWSSEYGFKIIR